VTALEAELRIATQTTRAERDRLRRLHLDETISGASDDMFALGMRGSRGEESKDRRGRSVARATRAGYRDSNSSLTQKEDSNITE